MSKKKDKSWQLSLQPEIEHRHNNRLNIQRHINSNKYRYCWLQEGAAMATIN